MTVKLTELKMQSVMKFYNREKELEILKKNWELSAQHSIMTTLIGRRRTGKTSLLLKSVEGEKHLYLYISKDNEQLLCSKFQSLAEQVIGLHIYGSILTFRELFTILMNFGKQHHFTLIIDEFQNLLNVNPAIPSEIQDIWDRTKDDTKVNLILCGSIYSMMKKIFENGDEPLYGRRDSALRLLPFSIEVIKQILADHHPDYCPDDLLCLYMLTGGVAKYVAQLMDANAVTKDKMLDFAFAQDSPFLTEGNEMIISEFGRDYGTYFSILQLISAGKTTQTEIDSVIGKNTGSYLSNLHFDYSFISKNTPILSKPNARNIRWTIDDCFLRFWFRFVYPFMGLIESNQLQRLLQYVKENYDSFSGKTLERYFQEKEWQTGKYNAIGNWWGRKGVNELDLVAICDFDGTGLIAEIKRNPQKIDPNYFKDKVTSLPIEFKKYQFHLKTFSLEDM